MKHLTTFLLLLSLSAAAGHAVERKVLVYTRNFTPDGKGLVTGHDNGMCYLTPVNP